MRSDYGLYGVALICFVLAAVFAGSLVPGYPFPEAPGLAVTVVFLLIGVIAAAVGYSARPKPLLPAHEPAPAPPVVATTPIGEPNPITEENPTPPPPPPTPLEEVSVSPEPAPLPLTEPVEPSPPVTTVEEPASIEAVAEEKPKTTRRRRKKAVA